MASIDAALVKNQYQLTQLQGLRNERLKAELQEALRNSEKAEEQVKARNKVIADHKQHMLKASSLESTLPNAHGFVGQRQYWLAYELEREKYYLEMDIDELKEAKKKQIEMQQALARAERKLSDAKTTLNRMLAAMERQRELFIEREQESINRQNRYVG